MTDRKNQIEKMFRHKQRYWHEFQSPATCRIGSDGVGHDLIHPAAQLQSAYRNAWNMYNECLLIEEDIDLKNVELKRFELESVKKTDLDLEEVRIKMRRLKRQIIDKTMQLNERWDAFDVFSSHAQELQPIVEQKYKHIDEALPEIWASRIAYAATVKNHPLGNELKVALMTEEQKALFMQFMNDRAMFPAKDMTGRTLFTPNADKVLEVLKGAQGWQKTFGLNSDQETLEQTRD